jgi:hypothetical protein
MLGQLPAVLALYRTQQAFQIGPHPPARLNPAKTRRDPLDQPIQPARPIDNLICCDHDHALHGRSDYPKNLGCSTSVGRSGAGARLQAAAGVVWAIEGRARRRAGQHHDRWRAAAAE